jgi:hypothetical protein
MRAGRRTALIAEAMLEDLERGEVTGAQTPKELINKP